jgi:DNA-binding LytR/AlgR family response regulator
MSNDLLLRLLSLEKNFSAHNIKLNDLLGQLHSRKKSRLVVRRGLEHIALKVEDVVLFYTENKLVYAIDRYGKKYFADKNLSGMEQELDDAMFFRANRQYIINIEFIKGFKPYEKVKLWVDMSLPDLNHHIVISQENAPQFREWMLNS